jgi:uncharacterized protein (TIGR02996 family)
MHDEAEFLQKIMESPADDTARLVYADWLDERGDDESARKSRFLRLTVHLTGPIRRPGWRSPRESEIRRLAAELPTDWLAVVSRLKIDYCGAKRAEDRTHGWLYRQFAFVCDVEWDEMAPTGDAAVRHCERCKENVHYCDTIVTAREHAGRGHCVAVDLGIIRRENDLAPRRTIRGRMLPRQGAAFQAQEDARLAVDEVSRAREERKRREKKADE